MGRRVIKRQVTVARFGPMVENPPIPQPKERPEAVPLLVRMHISDIMAGEAEELFFRLRFSLARPVRHDERALHYVVETNRKRQLRGFQWANDLAHAAAPS